MLKCAKTVVSKISAKYYRKSVAIVASNTNIKENDPIRAETPL